MEIPYEILPETEKEAKLVVQKINYLKVHNEPVVLMVRKGTFEKYSLKNDKNTEFPLNREGAVKCIIKELGENDIVVSTTGKTSR